MSEVEIYSQLSNSLSTTALFGIMWAFLLWVAGRSASVAIESDAGLVMKIAVTVFVAGAVVVAVFVAVVVLLLFLFLLLLLLP